MIKSQDQLDRITAIFNVLDGNLLTSGENRRQQPRVPFRIQITLTILSPTMPVSMHVVTRNLSASGIGFVSRRMLRPTERVAVLLAIPKFSPKLILARITFGRYVSGGLYEMGAEFLECICSDPKSGQELQIPPQWCLPVTAKSAAHAAAAT